jgi:hypothetical protein
MPPMRERIRLFPDLFQGGLEKISGHALMRTMSKAMTPEEALQTAIEKAGGLTDVGRLFAISPQAVDQWTVCPPHRVLKLEEASGVPRYKLRPDLYPRPGEA